MSYLPDWVSEFGNSFVKKLIKGSFVTVTSCHTLGRQKEFQLHVLNISPSAYKGADSVSVGSIVMCLPHNIIKTYGAFIDYFFGRSIKHNIFQNMGLYYLVYGIVIITLAMEILELLNKSKIKVLLITAACAVLPMSAYGLQRP